ncbi:hypothetical protein DLH72_01265 [Candidatus Gracilibacteria bacterium]|nr:MAG: hypothetical protein DLH72_01265 [Candidatus Gracilibacteria bacterium]
MKLKIEYNTYGIGEMEIDTDDINFKKYGYDSYEAIPEEEKFRILHNYIIDEIDWDDTIREEGFEEITGISEI